jgi:hypothetical protein
VDVLPVGAIFTYEWKPGTKELAKARFFGTPVETKAGRTTKAILGAVQDEQGINKTALVSRVRELLPSDTGINYIRDTIDLLAEEGQLTAEKGSRNATLYGLPD